MLILNVCSDEYHDIDITYSIYDIDMSIYDIEHTFKMSI